MAAQVRTISGEEAMLRSAGWGCPRSATRSPGCGRSAIRTASYRSRDRHRPCANLARNAYLAAKVLTGVRAAVVGAPVPGSWAWCPVRRRLESRKALIMAGQFPSTSLTSKESRHGQDPARLSLATISLIHRLQHDRPAHARAGPKAGRQCTYYLARQLRGPDPGVCGRGRHVGPGRCRVTTT